MAKKDNNDSHERPDSYYFGEQTYGRDIRDNPRSILPNFQNEIAPSGRDVLLSALMGFGKSMGASQAAAANGDPLLASLAGIAGAAGQPGPQAVMAQRMDLKRQQMLAQLEASPVEQVAPDLAEKYKELKGLPLSTFQKIAPLLQRNEDAEKRLEIALMRLERASADKQTAAKEKSDAQAEKQSLKDAELELPGYKLGGKIRPKADEAKALREGVAQTENFLAGVARLRELVEKNGSSDFIGKDAGEAETLAANLKLTLKEVQKLGVLSSSDIAFLEAQVFDPSSKKSIFTSKGTALRQLDTITDRAQKSLAASIKSRGYEPDGGGSVGDPSDMIRALKAQGKSREQIKAALQAAGF